MTSFRAVRDRCWRWPEAGIEFQESNVNGTYFIFMGSEMASIRAVLDWRLPTEREVWLRITDHATDDDGYLSLFRLHFTDGTVKDYHLYRRGVSLLDVATSLFGGATSLRSAKGLLEEMNKVAGKEEWNRKAGTTGLVIGSAALLYEFLKTRPFRQEGYYDGEGNLFLDRTIHTRNASDYDPG